MGVKVDDGEVGVLVEGRHDERVGQQVFAAEGQRELALAANLLHGG